MTIRKAAAVVIVIAGGIIALGSLAPAPPTPTREEKMADMRNGMMACLDARGEAELFGEPFRCMKRAGLYSASDCMALPSQYGPRCLQEIQTGLKVENLIEAMHKSVR